jgi:hypothetical protein
MGAAWLEDKNCPSISERRDDRDDARKAREPRDPHRSRHQDPRRRRLRAVRGEMAHAPRSEDDGQRRRNRAGSSQTQNEDSAP